LTDRTGPNRLTTRRPLQRAAVSLILTLFRIYVYVCLVTAQIRT